jgi:hypothetical protein
MVVLTVVLKIPSYSLIFGTIAAASTISVPTSTNCACGYYEPSTKELFTESTIVYFNETDVLPSDLIIQSYENRYEKGWNTQYRTGSASRNVNIGNASSTLSETLPQALELYCDVTTPEHLVMGGGVYTSRQDIFFGSFRTMFRPTQQWLGGSALSMMLNFNETESWQVDQINPNNPKNAWVSMISHSQFPDRSLGVNISDLTSNTTSFWNYTEFRVDWSRDELRYYVGGKLFRSVTRSQDSLLPQTPGAVFLKHWSTGNFFSTQGPPASRSMANIAWVRMFFNSSLTTDKDHMDFSSRCQISDACSIDNMQLRGSSAYPPEALLKWKQDIPVPGIKLPAKVIAITSILISMALFAYNLLRRMNWNNMKPINMTEKKSMTKPQHNTPYEPSIDLVQDRMSWKQSCTTSGIYEYVASPNSTPQMIPMNRTHPSSTKDFSFHTGASLSAVPSSINLTDPGTQRDLGNGKYEQRNQRQDPAFMESFNANAIHATEAFVVVDSVANERHGRHMSDDSALSDVITSSSYHFTPPSTVPSLHSLSSSPEKKADQIAVTVEPVEFIDAKPSGTKGATAPAKRVDYLAGLVALSSLFVTAIHFCLTFSAAAINPDAYVHNDSEIWARKTVTSYFLNLNWIGPFLMTSTRFLVSNYLRTGDLRNVAEKTVQRPFRLLIPIAAIAMLEYFLMDSGATAWLEYLPSVTWSTWPFTTVPSNFGNFVSEILQLAYLIPNAAPQITFNYCTGVLWTIPVQLQGSWVTLLGTIMIREVKTPWKRFAFYTWCVLIHWYALSWGTYFYLGIMLTDLDLTYQWKNYLYTNAFAYYPLVSICMVLSALGLGIDLLTQHTGVNYAQYEYGIHPDITTGLSIMSTPIFSYPQYYIPKLNGLVFSVAFQALVEISPWAQKALSFKALCWVFPHIFTIYLIHGFIFWSIGSMLCIYLSVHNIPYSLNIFIVAVVTYGVLALSLPLLTPIVETLGKNVTKNIWQYAWEKPAPRRATLYPFPRGILEARKDGFQSVTSSIEGIDLDVERGEGNGEKKVMVNEKDVPMFSES